VVRIDCSGITAEIRPDDAVNRANEAASDIAAFYESGRSIRDCAALFGLSYWQTRDRLLQAGVTLRPNGFRIGHAPTGQGSGWQDPHHRTVTNLCFMRDRYPDWQIRIRDSGRLTAAKPGILLSADNEDELVAQLEAHRERTITEQAKKVTT